MFAACGVKAAFEGGFAEVHYFGTVALPGEGEVFVHCLAGLGNGSVMTWHDICGCSLEDLELASMLCYLGYDLSSCCSCTDDPYSCISKVVVPVPAG